VVRPDTWELYHSLVETEFRFVPRVIYHVNIIYQYVRERYGSLCDDRYKCRDNCLSKLSRPEWQHITRGALDTLKKRKKGNSSKKRVQKAKERGFWIFS
jgi:hypothetical protein